MLLGGPAVAMTQFRATEKWACFPGLAGQAGWFAGLQPDQPGMLFVSVLCCAAWTWGLWRYWIRSWLSSSVTPTASPTGCQELRKAPGGALSDKARKRAMLRRVK